MWRVLFIIIPLLGLFILALLFGAHNRLSIPVNFIIAEKEMTVSSLLAIFLGLGFFCGVLSMSFSYWRERIRNRRLTKELARRES